MKLVGRDCDTFLADTIPTIIKYLDFSNCDKQHTMCEEMNFLAASIRSSQTELEATSRSLEDAMNALTDYAQNPTNQEVFCSTSDILNDAVDVAEGHQKEAIGKAIAIAKKVSSTYNTEDLSPPAKYSRAKLDSTRTVPI